MFFKKKKKEILVSPLDLIGYGYNVTHPAEFLQEKDMCTLDVVVFKYNMLKYPEGKQCSVPFHIIKNGKKTRYYFPVHGDNRRLVGWVETKKNPFEKCPVL